MEKIREALAKARSDKAFRDHHPVADVNAYRERQRPGSNEDAAQPEDNSEPVLEPVLEPVSKPQPLTPSLGGGRDAVPDEPSGATDRPESLPRPGEDEATAELAIGAPAELAVDAPAPAARADEDEMETVRDQPAIAGIEVEEQPAVVVDSAPRAVRKASRSTRKWMRGVIVVVLAVLVGLVLVHFFLVPLEVLPALLSGDADMGEDGKATIAAVQKWLSYAVDIIVKLLGAPES